MNILKCGFIDVLNAETIINEAALRYFELTHH